MTAVKLKLHSTIVTSKRTSAGRRWRTESDAKVCRVADEREPTVEDVEALVCAATPHFAFQIRARVRALIAELPDDHPTRRFGEEKIEMLERLGYSTTKALEGPLEPATRIGWETLPSHRAVRAAGEPR